MLACRSLNEREKFPDSPHWEFGVCKHLAIQAFLSQSLAD
jgi:hypothetical protein